MCQLYLCKVHIRKECHTNLTNRWALLKRQFVGVTEIETESHFSISTCLIRYVVLNDCLGLPFLSTPFLSTTIVWECVLLLTSIWWGVLENVGNTLPMVLPTALTPLPTALTPLTNLSANCLAVLVLGLLGDSKLTSSVLLIAGSVSSCKRSSSFASLFL